MNTAAEAIRALSMQMPGFRRQMNEGWYQIRIAGDDTAPEAVYARLHEQLGEGTLIHIVPRLAGAGKGGLQIVLGAAAIVGSFFTAGASMALWGSALAAGGFSATTMLFSLGASMILGGVAQMLAPKAKVPEYKSTDNGRQNTYFSSLDNMIAQGNPMPVPYGEMLVGGRQNTYFSSLDNMIAQGNPMPVPYGEMLVGSRRISQDISTRDEGGDGKVVVIGRQA
ncbi:tail assembly protein [Escherichia coli]|uniref:tail assembly protein n=4 Tax=Escherichia coli TaxID=562 RepID=UPI001E2A5334|nr:tail assembly protein [Escherichia coli]